MPDPNVPTPPPLTPYLTVGDAKAAIDFYVRAFGAKEVSRQPTPDGTKIIHAALTLENGGLVMLSDDFPAMGGGKSRDPKKVGGGSVTLHLDLPDVKKTWARAMEAGATERMPLAVQFWGDEYGILEDPFGHRWSLATRGGVPTKQDLDAGAAKHFPAGKKNG
jgi:PhnB protein